MLLYDTIKIATTRYSVDGARRYRQTWGRVSLSPS